MKVVEWVIYLGLAVVVGGLVLLAFSRMTQTSAEEIMSAGESKEEFLIVRNNTIVPALFALWDGCQQGEKEGQFYFQLQATNPVTREDVFEEVKKNGLCRTLSDLNLDCGNRDNVVIAGNIEPYRVYIARCDTNNKQLVIE